MGKIVVGHACKKGESSKAGATGGYSWTFPYQQSDPNGPKRTEEGTFHDASEALRRRQAHGKSEHVNGVKGPSWLQFLDHYNSIDGMPIDYMHGFLLGVQKLLLKLWFSQSYSKEPFSFSKFANLLDKRLKGIMPTLEVKRLPRSISEYLKYWKANELRSFLLYYGIPSLYGILSTEYFEHYVLFSHAIFLLLKDSISEEDLNQAEKNLETFCKYFQALYPKRYYTLNVHNLLHLVYCVRALGPLYVFSCFPFEDKNGFLLKLIHGTQFIESQIISAVSIA